MVPWIECAGFPGAVGISISWGSIVIVGTERMYVLALPMSTAKSALTAENACPIYACMPRPAPPEPMIRETLTLEKSLLDAIEDARRRTRLGAPVPSRAEMIRQLLREALRLREEAYRKLRGQEVGEEILNDA